MKKYLALFKTKFLAGLQYRGAAFAGIITQICWGFLEISLFKSFYTSKPENFPMSFQAMSSYIWLQQAFISLYMLWFWENDIFSDIKSGNVAYTLARPVSVYSMWFMQNLASRTAKASLRAIPILFIGFLLPQPYGLSGPYSLVSFLLFICSMILAVLVLVALMMPLYFIAFYTLEPMGPRMVFQTLGDFLSGAIIPLPFLPNGFRQFVESLPFASVQNVPFRIYSGDLAGEKCIEAVVLQVFWLVFLLIIGKVLERCVQNKIIVQGG